MRAGVTSWLSRRVADCLLEDGVLDVLEAADAESVESWLAARPPPQPPIRRGTLAAGAAAAAAIAVWKPSIGVAGGLLFPPVLAWCVREWWQCGRAVRGAVASAERARIQAAALLRALKHRQVAAFGVGIPCSLSAVRWRTLLSLRQWAREMHTAAQDLHHHRVEEQVCLLWSCMPSEMRQLMEWEGEDEATRERLGALPALQTVYELCFLQRSELLRLVLLQLIDGKMDARLSDTLNRLNTAVDGVTRDMRHAEVCLTRGGSRGVREKKVVAVVESTPTARATVQLEALLDGLYCGSVDESQLIRALRSILASLGAREMDIVEKKDEGRGDERDEEERVEEERKPVPLNQPPRDEFFEALSAPEAVSCWSGYEEEVLDRQTGSAILGELRAALTGRAEDMQRREMRALAAFYGTTEEEMAEKLRVEKEEEERREQERRRGPEELHGEGEGVEEKKEEEERPRAPLANDLLAALMSRRGVAETVIGDSDDDDQ